MLTYLFRRLMLIVPTLVGATLLVFLVVQLSPGSVTASLLAEDGAMRPAERQERERYLKERYGLGQPIYVQYCRWLNAVSPFGFKDRGEGVPAALPVGFKIPDLGNSFTRGRPVGELISEALPQTMILQIVSLPISYLIAVVIGMIAATRRGGLFDTGSGVTTLALWSLPSIWVAVMLIGLLANSQFVNLFPANDLNSLESADMPFLPTWTDNGVFVSGWLLDRVWHMVLPVICLSYANLAFLSKLTRGAMLDTIAADFVRTARAKGVAERAVILRHAFRNSLIPLITYLGTILPALLTGSVIVETVYGINGMGRLFVDAVKQKDQELLLSLIVIGTLLSIVGTLLADILNVLADPRVSYES